MINFKYIFLYFSLFFIFRLTNSLNSTEDILLLDVDDTIDDIITPSDTCKVIVARFASAISNFTLCSVTNARPIHICQWCVHQYLIVLDTHAQFFSKIDEKGNPCRDYFTNLDRIEIVTVAYNYVQNLWKKGNCDYCFEHFENGSLKPQPTDETLNFEIFYIETKMCFDQFKSTNDTCTECKMKYGTLNEFYVKIGDKIGDSMCLDIVDTLNITRGLWSGYFNCLPERKSEVILHVCIGIFAFIPLIFYVLASALSSKQEGRVLIQRRLAEGFTISTSGGSQNSSTGLVQSAQDYPYSADEPSSSSNNILNYNVINNNQESSSS